MFGLDAALVVLAWRRWSLTLLAAFGMFALIAITLCVSFVCGGIDNITLEDAGRRLSLIDLRLLTQGAFWHGGGVLAAWGLIQARLRHRLQSLVCIAASLLTLGVGIDALLVEPYLLEVKRYTIHSPKVTKPIRIAFAADIQVDGVGSYERRALRLLQQQNADLILWGGDYIQARNKPDKQRLETALHDAFCEAKLDAPLGVWAVQGNVDYNSAGTLNSMFEGTNIQYFAATCSFEIDEVRLTLLHVGRSFSQINLPNDKDGRFHIVVGHSPCFAIGKTEGDLLLAGHTHGGQVQIPFYGPILTASPSLPRRWASGMTNLENGGTLIVSHGIGLERGNAPRIRFFCRPQIVVIDVLPSESAN
ncbi:MAG: metallophosphoesterase [Thermoguttaceae bacterium]